VNSPPSLLQVAPSKEVLIGVSNVNPLREGMLDTFLSGVKQAGVTNYLVVALDQETATDLHGRGFNTFYMPIQVTVRMADRVRVVCLPVCPRPRAPCSRGPTASLHVGAARKSHQS
jgi:hypothetical protein